MSKPLIVEGGGIRITWMRRLTQDWANLDSKTEISDAEMTLFNRSYPGGARLSAESAASTPSPSYHDVRTIHFTDSTIGEERLESVLIAFLSARRILSDPARLRQSS